MTVQYFDKGVCLFEAKIPFLSGNKYDNQFEQVCKSIHCISMAVLLGCVMLKVSLLRL